MAALIPWGNPQQCNVNGEVGFTAGEELKGIGQHGFVDQYLIVKCQSEILVGAGGASAFTATQQLAFLDSHYLDLRLDGDPSKATLTSLDDDNPFHPYQKATLGKILRVDRHLFEKDLPGYADSSTGLAQVFTASSTITLKWQLLVSLGIVEFINEDEALFGIGPDQLERLALKLRVTTDYPASIDADLTYNKLTASFVSYRVPAQGRRVTVPPRFRRYTPASTAQSVRTSRGVPLVVVDIKQPYATYAKGQLTVEVGGQTVTKPPQTATDIREEYTLHPDVGAPETTVADLVTEIYVNADTGYAQLRSGELVARQETLLEAWDVEEVALSSPTDTQWLGYLMGCTRTLPAGSKVHWMSTPKLNGMKVPARLLPSAGYSGFFSYEPEAKKHPSVIIDTAGGVQIDIPLEYLAPAVRDWADGKTQGGSAGQAKVLAAINNIVEWLPGGYRDDVNGAPNPSGGGGAETLIYTQVSERISKFGMAELERRGKGGK